jgi:hypothetical protein
MFTKAVRKPLPPLEAKLLSMFIFFLGYFLIKISLYCECNLGNIDKWLIIRINLFLLDSFLSQTFCIRSKFKVSLHTFNLLILTARVHEISWSRCYEKNLVFDSFVMIVAS